MRRSQFGSWRVVAPALAAALVLAVVLSVRERGTSPNGDVPRGTAARLALHPAADVALGAGDSLVLAWRPERDATRFLVEVLDADGRVALTATTTDTMLVVRKLGPIASGRGYRWWVRAFGAGGAQVSASTLGVLRITRP